MLALFILGTCLSVAAGSPGPPQRIVGGSATTVSQYPMLATLLYSSWSSYSLCCGGSILTTRSVLTAASCCYDDAASRFRVRVGSSYVSSGGVVHALASIIAHSGYNRVTFDNDIAILHTSTAISYVTDAVQPAPIALASYQLADNELVWAVGWGRTSAEDPLSEQLRHVQVWTVNQATCAQRYANDVAVTANMLCSSWLDVGGRGQCKGDGGSPLLHGGVVVGISSWSRPCALPYYPDVNTRVSRYTNWIQHNVV